MPQKFGYLTPFVSYVQLIGAEDIFTGANTSLWVSMQDYQSGVIAINIGEPAGGAVAVSLDQATDAAGTGTKTLGFTTYWQSGQKIVFTGRSATNFLVGDTLTGSSSGLTAYVVEVSSDHLWVAPVTGGTTWTDGETITGTGGATAKVSGTGTYEDVPVKRTATSDTFSTAAVEFKQYFIPISNEMLDADNDFTHFQLDMGKAAAGSTIGGAIFIPDGPRVGVYPPVSLIGAYKVV